MWRCLLVDGTTCDAQTGQCTPTSGTISVGWTAYGDTFQGVENAKYNTSDYTMTRHFRRSWADTWASGSIFGALFSGAGTTYRGTLTEHLVYRHIVV